MMKVLLFMILFPVMCTNAQSSFDTKIADASKLLKCNMPDERNPVVLNAELVSEKDSIAVIVKAILAPGWHIYSYVPSTLPYIPIDHILQLPENIRAVGDWQKTTASASVNDPGVLIYEQEAVFVRKAVKSPSAKPGGTIKTGLYYQTCNLRQCLPPVEKIFALKY